MSSWSGINRRGLLLATCVFGLSPRASLAQDTNWKTLGDAEWAQRLSPSQFAVLRRSETETPGSSELDKERRRGVYRCAGCSSELFQSEEKFDSQTGWPSFSRPLKAAVETSPDLSMRMRRTAVSCARCAGHLGHVFKDGPPPTGLRYCINGLALTFARA